MESKTTHPREAKSGGQNPGNGFWDSENHSPTGGKNPGNGFWNSENHSPVGGREGGYVAPFGRFGLFRTISKVKTCFECFCAVFLFPFF